MWALDSPAAPPRSTTGWSDARLLLGVCVAAAAIASTGLLPPEATAVTAVAAVHGGLIAAALVWNGVAVGDAVIPVVLLAVARMAAAAHPAGAVTYLAVPLWLARLAWANDLRRAGLGRPQPWGSTVIGALAGAALALHLFICAARTFGYGIHFVPLVVLPAIAYDVGANVISAELFFRGVVLARLWRRCTFPVALGAAAAVTALRYCVDPFAATTELRLGAAVYMTLLAILNGILYRWAGSLLPGVAAAAVFFAGYRLIGRG